LSNDELPLSESDTESEDEIEMLWGSQKKDAKDNESEEPFQSLLQELNAQVLILIPREYLIRLQTFDPLELHSSILMLYATVVFFNGLCPLLSYSIANRIQSKHSQAIKNLLDSQRSLGRELSPLHPNDPWSTLIQVLFISHCPGNNLVPRSRICSESC
jgi:hypothetical protein